MLNLLKRPIWLVAFAMIFSVALEARDYYGAISYSPSTGKYGYSYDYNYRSGAESAARNQCARRDCSTLLWFRNACGSLAVGRNGYGSGWGSNRARAKREALKSCRRYTGGCRVVNTICTTR